MPLRFTLYDWRHCPLSRGRTWAVPPVNGPACLDWRLEFAHPDVAEAQGSTRVAMRLQADGAVAVLHDTRPTDISVVPHISVWFCSTTPFCITVT